jgi:hypothetical protein
MSYFNSSQPFTQVKAPGHKGWKFQGIFTIASAKHGREGEGAFGVVQVMGVENRASML